MEIIRTKYLDKLNALKDQNIIKVITGIRRCGKSVILKQFAEQLQKDGVEKERIQSYNFEIIGTPVSYLTLHEQIKNKLVPNQKNYIFLDEIQNINHFEKTVDSLFAMGNVDLYITGSNAFMLSGELSTLLSGRYIEINVLPLSFSEYLEFFQDKTDIAFKFAKYLKNGGMPQAYTMFEQGENIGMDYLQGVYNTIAIKDIVEHQNIKDPKALENVTKFLFDNIGNPVSPNKIADYMKSNNHSIDQRVVEKIINAICGSFIMYAVDRYDIKGKELLKTKQKYYLTDISFRRAILGLKDTSDSGHILENIVFLELLRRGYKIWIGKTNNGREIDFVAKSSTGELEYFQVTESMRDESTRNREFSALKDIDDNYPKTIITNDFTDGYENEGIKVVNIIKWLLGN